jgi:hypothetical protein
VKTIEAETAALKPEAVRIHPNAAESYRRQVRYIKAALAAADLPDRDEAMRAMRD